MKTYLKQIFDSEFTSFISMLSTLWLVFVTIFMAAAWIYETICLI